jgi:NAD-dependent deacetylase
MKRAVVFTGAGVSAESGISTFRDSGGLWEQYRIEDVATPGAWHKDPALVLDFYNQRRRQVLSAQPNAAHKAIAALEQKFHVDVITQNIDDLHERAGSQHVLHLHGELRKSRSTVDPQLVYDIDGWELKQGDQCAKGSQLRPHIVWFGEPVPAMDDAVQLTLLADIFIIVGTSLEVYPAAGLVSCTNNRCKKILIDPNAGNPDGVSGITIMKEKAGIALPLLVQKLLNDE